MHGHTLLLNHLNTLDVSLLKGKTLIEIGSVREDMEGQNSTKEFATFCHQNKMQFISVDMDPECTQHANDIFKELKNNTFLAITQKGEEYLKTYPNKIDFIYFDAFDYYHDYHSDKRKERYKTILNKKITNENCWKMHLECCQNILGKINKNTVICFDDILDKTTFDGKGKQAIPFLLKNGFKVLEYQKHCLLLKQ